MSPEWCSPFSPEKLLCINLENTGTLINYSLKVSTNRELSSLCVLSLEMLKIRENKIPITKPLN